MAELDPSTTTKRAQKDETAEDKDRRDELVPSQTNKEQTELSPSQIQNSQSELIPSRAEQFELSPAWKRVKDHPIENVLGDLNKGVLTRRSIHKFCNFASFVSQIEPNSIDQAIDDEHWAIAMQEELNQFIRNDVWELVPRPNDHTIIGLKWIFRNKTDELGQ